MNSERKRKNARGEDKCPLCGADLTGEELPTHIQREHAHVDLGLGVVDDEATPIPDGGEIIECGDDAEILDDEPPVATDGGVDQSHAAISNQSPQPADINPGDLVGIDGDTHRVSLVDRVDNQFYIPSRDEWVSARKIDTRLRGGANE